MNTNVKKCPHCGALCNANSDGLTAIPIDPIFRAAVKALELLPTGEAKDELVDALLEVRVK